TYNRKDKNGILSIIHIVTGYRRIQDLIITSKSKYIIKGVCRKILYCFYATTSIFQGKVYVMIFVLVREPRAELVR
ncbi:MAG: hypothetical protein LC540_20165, partial [Candidatus Thiodiazotropha sp.]|nr:hypothetical protein [Candidatus Thiodiazotropha sp.]